MIVFSVEEVNAQNESGMRNYLAPYETSLRLQRRWFDSITDMNQHRFPIIRSVPPLSTSMPFNVLLSYIYTDSLLRFAPRKAIRNRISSWTSLNDTLRWMAYGDYVMSDYNPILFCQYRQETSNLRENNTSPNRMKSLGSTDTLPPYSGKYKSTYDVIKPNLELKLAQLLPNQSESKAMMSLLACDYILKIKVLSIDSMPDKLMSSSFPGSYYYYVTAMVLDTIKGKVLPPSSLDLAKKSESTHQTGNATIIRFGYTDRLYNSLGVVENEGIHRYSNADSAFIKNGDLYTFSMKSNQEAIVFLSYFNYIFDYQNDYYDLSLDALASFGALPIIDGNVRDVNKVWSSNLLSPYTAWKSNVNTFINKILTRNY
jgi:hypothetical protein